MLGTKEIKSRIRGVTNIKQITRAMEMVAASRLKRSQSRALSSRPYFNTIKTLMVDLLSYNEARSTKHEARGKIGLVFVTSDRGLCGGFIANVLRSAQLFIRENRGQGIRLIPIGKRGYDFMRRRGYPIFANFSQPSKEIPRTIVEEIVTTLLGGYGEAFNELHLLYTRFESVTRSTPIISKLLPLEGEFSKRKSPEPLLEPDVESLLQVLLTPYLIAQIYGAMTESLASEQGARMVAMRAATDNAEDMIKTLTLNFNKARQATITKELLEVVTGAEALRNQ